MAGAPDLEQFAPRRRGALEREPGELRRHHPVGGPDHDQRGCRHTLPRDRRAKADVAGGGAGADREVEQGVDALGELSLGLRIERDLVVVGDLVDRDPQVRGESPDGPHQGCLARERRVGVHVGMGDAVADRRVDVGLAREQVPAHDPAERVAEQDHRAAAPRAGYPDGELEHPEVGLEGRIPAPALGDPVAGPIDDQRVEAVARERGGEPEMPAAVVAEPGATTTVGAAGSAPWSSR